MTMDIYQSFEGKSVFFTGVTGFVGKVLLYKLMKEFKDLKHIYVLIRPKKNQTPMARFQKEVLSSACFAPLIKEIGQEEWDRRAKTIYPVAGDMLQDGLGLSDVDTAHIAKNCNVIIHLAATVDFMEKLNMSVKMNVLGTLRVMALAKKCQNIEAVVHTSTCYVNWNRPGASPVKETIYPLNFDAEAMCKYILSIDDKMLAEEQAKLMKQYGFPNTYTLTKRMTEHILEANYKNVLPLSIVRPAIIGASWKEPCPGWVDALTAAGGIFLTVGLGIVKELMAQPSFRADVVPVDFVCNTLIKTAYKTMIHHKRPTIAHPAKPLSVSAPAGSSVPTLVGKGGAVSPGVVASNAAASQQANVTSGASVAESTASDGATMPFVFASSTSNTLNPCYWEICCKSTVDYWIKHPHEKSISKASIQLCTNTPHYLWRWYAYRKIPFESMKLFASLPPPIGSASNQKLLKRYAKALFRAEDMNMQFQPFTMYEWKFDNSNTKFLDEGLPDKHFIADTYDINWYNYIHQYQYGMIKFIMRSPEAYEPPMPLSGSELFLKASL